MIRLMHPVHGWHFASQADNIEAMRQAGWVEDDGRALAEKLAPAAVVKTEAESPAEVPVKRGPGRPRKV
jgi:hypothetical protein